jgi:hypothetical protein
MAQPQVVLSVDAKQAENFSKVWTYKGLAMPVSEVTLQFATDFANVVLTGFISQCQQRAAQAKADEAEQQKASL